MGLNAKLSQFTDFISSCGNTLVITACAPSLALYAAIGVTAAGTTMGGAVARLLQSLFRRAVTQCSSDDSQSSHNPTVIVLLAEPSSPVEQSECLFDQLE